MWHQSLQQKFCWNQSRIFFCCLLLSWIYNSPLYSKFHVIFRVGLRRNFVIKSNIILRGESYGTVSLLAAFDIVSTVRPEYLMTSNIHLIYVKWHTHTHTHTHAHTHTFSTLSLSLSHSLSPSLSLSKTQPSQKVEFPLTKATLLGFWVKGVLIYIDRVQHF